MKREDGQRSAQACSKFVPLEPEDTFEKRKQEAIQEAESDGYRLSYSRKAKVAKDGTFEHSAVSGVREFPATHFHLRFIRDAPD